jgi:Phosphoribosylaminoimidazole (AIR) synthetase
VSSGGRTYEAAGVSLAAAEAVVDRLRSAVESTGAEGSVASRGSIRWDERRFLAATTDGVGSKLVLSRRAGRLRDAGRDLAAHCIDDVLTTGAEPLFLLDYVAAHELELEQVAELVEGAAEVCREAGCALIGGETAELPGVYREQELDFAGTCVGIVDRERLIDGKRCEPGDVVLGLPSSGLHTNGFSLVRALVGEDDFDADLLLAPHRLYLDDVRALRERADVQGARARDRRRDPRKPLARAARRWRRGARLGLVGAPGGLRMARRAGCRRGGAAAGLQPRGRDVRSRPGRRCRRGRRDRQARVIGVLVSGEGTNCRR